MAPSSLESRVSKVKSRKREDGMVRAAAPPNRHGFSAPSTNKRKSRKPTGSQRAASPPLPPSTSQVHSFRAASQPADSCSASLRSPQTHLIAAARGARFSSFFFFVLSSGGGGQLSSRCRRPLDGCPPPRGMDATGPELQNNSLTRPFLYQPAIPMLKEGGPKTNRRRRVVVFSLVGSGRPFRLFREKRSTGESRENTSVWRTYMLRSHHRRGTHPPPTARLARGCRR